MTTADAAPKCPYCGALPHSGVCPSVKAIEYHDNGSIKRVEFKTAADYAAWNPQLLTGATAKTVQPAVPVPYRCREGRGYYEEDAPGYDEAS